MALAGVTGGELTIKDVIAQDLRMIRLVFARLGLESELRGEDLFVPGGQKLVIHNDAGGYQPKVEDGPWPAFPADLTSIALALATQSEGSVIIHEKMFENRLFFTDKLQLMGARSRSAIRTARSSSARAGCAGSGSSRRTSAPAWRC